MKETIKISASDGFALSVTSFVPKRFNNRIILINSATGVKQHYYHDFAEWLAGQGFRVYTYDYRGIGGSRPESLKGFEATMHQWGTLDYHSMLKYLILAFPESPLTVIGHSVGGQIIGMSPLSENVDNIITVAAQTPYWKNYPGKLKLAAFWYVLIPMLTKLFGYFPAKSLRLFEDLPLGVATQWSCWAKNSNYIFDEMPYMKERFSALHQSALMISFSDDQFAPEKAVNEFKACLKNVKWMHTHIHPDDILQSEIGHFSFFKKIKAPLFWSMITDWINTPNQLKESKAA